MWLPFFVTGPYWEIFTGHSHDSSFFTCLLAGANSALNPLVYIPTLKSYRRELYRCVGCHKKRSAYDVCGQHSFSEFHHNVRHAIPMELSHTRNKWITYGRMWIETDTLAHSCYFVDDEITSIDDQNYFQTSKGHVTWNI